MFHPQLNSADKLTAEISLDLLMNDDLGDLRGSNRFHLTDGKLAHLGAENNEGDDFDKTWNIPISATLAFGDDENFIISDGSESKNSDNFVNSNKCLIEHDFSLDENEEKYVINDGILTLEETNKIQRTGVGVDDEGAHSSCKVLASGRVTKKFTISSNIEEIRNELEYEISSASAAETDEMTTIFEGSEIFQQIISDTSQPVITMIRRHHHHDKRPRSLIRGEPYQRDDAYLSTRSSSMLLEQRLKMISSLKELLEERKMIKLKNNLLNKKCCLYLDKLMPAVIGRQRLFESIETPAGGGGGAGASSCLSVHLNQRYEAVLEDLMVMQTHYDNARPILVNESEKLKNSYESLLDIFKQALNELMHRELIIGSNCIAGKTGKLVNAIKIRSLMKKQETKFDQLSKIRVDYFKLNNTLSLINTKLRRLNIIMGHGGAAVDANSVELLLLQTASPTLTLMDYEQLIIINHSLMDKMDERDQELRKIRDKCTESISILSHMKESWDILSYDITTTTSKLEETTKMKEKARTLLAIEGSRRDSLRKNITKIHDVATGAGFRLLEHQNPLVKKMNIDSQTLETFKLKVPNEFMKNCPSSPSDGGVYGYGS